MKKIIKKPEARPERFGYYASAAAIAWTMVAAFSLGWTYFQHKQEIIEIARSEAQAAYNKDVTYRLWNAKHGGVYVPISSDTKPNPYLSHIPERDITTPSGRLLTLINPAYMIRQEHELEKSRYGIIGHLTSLKPVNPDNMPDQWEAKALKDFERGILEVSSIENINGEDYMRFMRPLATEYGCLKCHATQGYRVGDIRGGLSLSVPMKPLWTATRQHIIYNWLGHVLFWTLGLIMIVWGSKNLLRKTSKIMESELRYRMLFNNSNDAIFVHGLSGDMPGNFLEVNDVACQRLGYTREELLALSPDDIDDPASQNNIPEITRKLAGEGNVLFEAVHVAKDGKRISVEINAHLFEIGGQTTVLSIARDISERKRSEKRLQAERDRLKSILDSMPDGVYIASQGHDIEYINPVIGKEFGPVSGRKCYEYFHDRTEVCPWCKNQEVFSGKSVRWEWHSSKTGKTYDLFDTPIAGERGELSKLEIFHDITERKQAEEQSRNLQSQLLQSQKMESIGRLAGGVAHDFNNILTVITGYSELILLGLPSDSPLRGPLSTVRESGEKAAALTHQLLAFSRKQVLEMKAVDLNVVIEKMVKMLARMIREDITLELKTGAPIRNVLADPGQIEQVLMNLVVNARDAMPAGGQLIIATNNIDADEEYVRSRDGMGPGQYVMLSVTDSGVGMTPEIQEKIFEPFFTMKDEGKGTGLGLATVYGIIKQHNAHIFVDSEPGKGTTFSIYLSAFMEELKEKKKEQSSSMPKGSETILVVDDEPFIRQLVMDTLQPLGYRLFEASCGDDALQAGSSFDGDIDLLLTDMIMPGMNGMELSKELGTKHRGMKTLFMSGYSDELASHSESLSERLNFMPKPITPVMLAVRVREVLDGKI